GGGRTQLSARIGKEVQFRVSCERLNLQAPRGSIEACGGVKLANYDLEGACDRLTITWQEDHVVLEGKAQLKCRHDGQDMELKSDRLSLRLSVGTGEGGRRTTRMAPSVRSRRVNPEESD